MFWFYSTQLFFMILPFFGYFGCYRQSSLFAMVIKRSLIPVWQSAFWVLLSGTICSPVASLVGCGCFHDHHHGHLRTDGIKIFSWLATLGGNSRELLFAMSFVGMFVIGGITGGWWRRCR